MDVLINKIDDFSLKEEIQEVLIKINANSIELEVAYGQMINTLVGKLKESKGVAQALKEQAVKKEGDLASKINEMSSEKDKIQEQLASETNKIKEEAAQL